MFALLRKEKNKSNLSGIALAILCIATIPASAAETGPGSAQTKPSLKLDFSQNENSNENETIFCPQSIELKFGTQKGGVIRSVLEAFYPSRSYMKQLQVTEGSLIGDAKTRYQGDYYVKVFIVRSDYPGNAYKFGVWQNIVIRYYHEKGAVRVFTQQLNYFESAELAERCEQASYLLVK